MGMVAMEGRQPARGLTPACSYRIDVSRCILVLSSPYRAFIMSMRGLRLWTAMDDSICGCVRVRGGGCWWWWWCVAWMSLCCGAVDWMQQCCAPPLTHTAPLLLYRQAQPHPSPRVSPALLTRHTWIFVSGSVTSLTTSVRQMMDQP